jgi:hypothetical protein
MLSGWAVVHPHGIVCCHLVRSGDAAAATANAVTRAEAPAHHLFVPAHHLCKGALVLGFFFFFVLGF